MRICLVSQEYPPETANGGIGSQTYAKAHGLTALRHDVHVISASTDEREREYKDGPVWVTRIPGFYHRMPINTQLAAWVTYSADVAAALSALHARAAFDIVDFPDWGCESYVHLLNRTEWDRIPTVIHLHGPLVMFAHAIGWPDQDSDFYRLGTIMEGTCLRLADAVYSSSDCSADWCARHYCVARDQIPTLHTGVDTRLFYPRAAVKEARPTIIFVGRIDVNKGTDVLVDAACKLAEEYPTLQVQIIGRGEREFVNELRAKALASGLPDLLDFTGYVSAQELASYLRRAYVFAAPSVYEGGPGFAYLEAMACGLPVIACQGSGAAEVVRHAEWGLLIPPRDVKALVEALRLLLADPDLRSSMGTRARSFVETEADSRVCMKRMEAFYTAVARGATRTSAGAAAGDRQQ